MEDIRLESFPYELNGKIYQLRCNFNVLADIIAEFRGLPDLFDGSKGFLYYKSFLAAMLNDYADTQGWPERFTSRELGRILDFRKLKREDIQHVINLVINSVYVKKDVSEVPDEPAEAESKN